MLVIKMKYKKIAAYYDEGAIGGVSTKGKEKKKQQEVQEKTETPTEIQGFQPIQTEAKKMMYEQGDTLEEISLESEVKLETDFVPSQTEALSANMYGQGDTLEEMSVESPVKLDFQSSQTEAKRAKMQGQGDIFEEISVESEEKLESDLQQRQTEAKRAKMSGQGDTLEEIAVESQLKLASDTGARPKFICSDTITARGRGRGRGKVTSPEPDIPITSERKTIGRGRAKVGGKVTEITQGEPKGQELKSFEIEVYPKTVSLEIKQVPKPTLLIKTQVKKESPLDTVAELKQSLPEDSGLLPPRRKDFGREGRPINLRANHFQVKFDPTKKIHHFDINIIPEINTMKSLKRKVVAEMIKLHAKVFGVAKCVFDGERNMFTNHDLQLRREGNTFEVKWKDDEKEKQFHVDIKKVAEIRLHDLKEILEGRTRVINQTAIQALDVVMRHLSSMKYVTIGRSVFPSTESGYDLGGGAEMWRGFYQSLRPGQWKTLQLNLDVSNRSFYKEQHVLDFVCEICQMDPNNLRRWNMATYEREKIIKEIKGLRVEVTHTPIKRTYKIIGLSPKPAELQIFPLTTDEGTQQCTVGKYFLHAYKKRLSYPNLPCLQAQPAERHIYLPMEVCRIPRGQQYKKLTDVQTANMIKAAAAPAFIRERDIKNMVRNVNFQQDEFVKDFGLSFNDSLMHVQGRVLPPPQIQMKNNFRVEPKVGVWDMRSKQFYDPVSITNWGMLLFVDKRRFGVDSIENFIREMMNTGHNVGIEVRYPRFQEYCCGVENVPQVFNKIQEICKDLQLILVILPGRTSIYAEVKRCGDNIAGISTQCIQMKNASRPNSTTFTNIFMKINAKLGGTNSIIQCRPVSSGIFKLPVIILGADVTHPPAGDKSKPSIAAIIGSLDRYAVKYKAKICVQKHRVETILTLKEKVRELLIAFYKSTRAKPYRIIFYRDGVGEGQFYQILSKELIAIRQACQSLEQEYEPKITFLVVQKRHHTRLFCDDNEAIGKAKNVPPGTTVDRAIVHPIENDFYLCSHQGIQGTSRPTHYHILWDDSDFSADELQQLTYELCHTYVRCTRSVSIPSPAYYAHLAAFRARYHLENLQRECDRIGGDHNEWLQKMQNAVETHEKLGNMYFA